MIEKTCEICGTVFKIFPYRINSVKCCSRKCKDILQKSKPIWSKRKKFSKEHRKNLSEAHKNKFVGINHPRWKGGETIDKSTGYIMIYKPIHPNIKNNYIKRSRHIMEKHLGRYLKPAETIHHCGITYPLGSIENKQDDSLENLMLFPSNSSHIKYHHKLQKLKNSS